MTLTRFLLATACLYAVNASADDFQNFRIPSHHVTSLSAGFDGWYSYHLYRPALARDEESGWRGSTRADLFHLWETDRFLSQVRLNGDLNGWINNSRSRRTTGDTSRSIGHEDRKQLGEMLSAVWTGRAYPLTTPLGLQASVYGSAYWDQNWQSQTWTDHYPTSHYTSVIEDESWYYHYATRLSLMAGWGRVRDAGGIYQARVMEQRLRESGVLKGDLQPETIQRLAQLIYRRNDFFYQHERSDRYYWREVEEILKSDPAFEVGRLDTYNTYLAADPFFPYSHGYRPRGWFVGPTAQLTHQDDLVRAFHLRTDSNGDTLEHSSNHPRTHYDEVLAGLSASYHRPIGLRWQFDALSEFLVPVRPDADKKDRFRWTTQASVAYAITDRWRAEADVNHRRIDLAYAATSYQPKSVNDTWDLSLGALVAYYVEDRWAISTYLDYFARGWRNRSTYSDPSGEERDLRISVGLSHNFIGSGYPRIFY